MTCGKWRRQPTAVLSALMLSLVAHAQPLKSEPCGARQIVYCLVSSDVNLALPPAPLYSFIST